MLGSMDLMLLCHFHTRVTRKNTYCSKEARTYQAISAGNSKLLIQSAVLEAWPIYVAINYSYFLVEVG